VSLLLIGYLLLWMPPVQQRIVSLALRELRQLTGTNISIEHLSFRPFNRLIAENICIEDLQGNTLLSVGRLSARFDLFGLIDRRLPVRRIALKDFDVRLKRDSATSQLNVQFLIDAFASKDTTAPTARRTTVAIERIELSGGRFSYEDTGGVHLRLHDLAAELSLPSIDPKRMEATIRRLTLRESSGWEVRNLSAALSFNGQTLLVKELLLALPHSTLHIPQASVDCAGGGLSRAEILAKVRPADLQAFFPPLEALPHDVTLYASLAGRLPAVEIERLTVVCGQAFDCDLQAGVDDCRRWHDTPLRLNVRRLNLSPDACRPAFKALTGGAEMPAMLLRLGNTHIAGSAHGTLAQMQLRLNLAPAPGNIVLAGTVGYLPATGRTDFDLSLQTDSFRLNRWLQDSIFGNAALTLAANGHVAGGKLTAAARLNAAGFAFRRYCYRNILVDASCAGDSLLFRASLQDPNARLTMNGCYHAPPQGRPHLRLQAEADSLLLSEMHLAPEAWRQSELQAAVSADLYGSANPDDWEGSLAVDRLTFKNNGHLFQQKRLSLRLGHAPDNEKTICLQSDPVQAFIYGKFTPATLPVCLMNALHPILPAWIPHTPLPEKPAAEYLTMEVEVQNTERLSAALQLPVAIVAPAKIRGGWEDSTRAVRLYADFPEISINGAPLYRNRLEIQTDTAINRLTGYVRTAYVDPDTLVAQLNFFAESDSIDLKISYHDCLLDGSIAAGARLVNDSLRTTAFPDVYGSIYPSVTRFQEQTFDIENCSFRFSDGKYTIDRFAVNHQPANGSIRIDGALSKNDADSLTIDFQALQISPFLKIFQYDGLDLQAEINGKIIGKRLLAMPVFFTDRFTVKDIAVAHNAIGSLDLQSVWSDRRQAARLNIVLRQADRPNSTLSGYLSPAKDSIDLRLDLPAMPIDRLQPFAENVLFGLRGEWGAAITARGKMTQPDLQGVIFLQDVVAGVRMTNVRYRISDSIRIAPGALQFNRFRIADFNGNAATISGTIAHKNFRTFNADVRMTMKNFLALSNPIQTDSLFYGTLKLSGTAGVTGTEKALAVNASIREGTAGKVYIQLPEPEIESNRYGHITYVHPPQEDSSRHEDPLPIARPFSLPVRLAIDATVTPALTLGVIINPATKDAATVTGTGNIRLDCNLPAGDLKLTGNYSIDEGRCALSLQNITRKEFAIQKGSAVTFRGNPLATGFDLSAIYSLRADLVSLDESFAADRHLANTRVKTNCILNISGDAGHMNISYDVKTPDVDESVQRKISNLMHTDDIKIRQVAYLLALGSFYPPEGNKGAGAKAGIWTTLASSTLSSQLNNLLSSALKENWSVGTHFTANDDAFSNVEMDVSVSTRLFNNRLMLNTNIGYKNRDDQNNYSVGDVTMEYKLTKTGDISLKAYNVTGEKYYRQSQPSQGIGISYRKEAKTFGQLFRSTVKRLLRIKTEREDEE
jgi:hypothetical protein